MLYGRRINWSTLAHWFGHSHFCVEIFALAAVRFIRLDMIFKCSRDHQMGVVLCYWSDVLLQLTRLILANDGQCRKRKWAATRTVKAAYSLLFVEHMMLVNVCVYLSSNILHGQSVGNKKYYMRSRYTTEKISQKFCPRFFFFLFKISFAAPFTSSHLAIRWSWYIVHTHERRRHIIRTIFHRVAYAHARQSAATHTHIARWINIEPYSRFQFIFSSDFKRNAVVSMICYRRLFSHSSLCSPFSSSISLHAAFGVFSVRVRARCRKLWDWISFAPSFRNWQLQPKFALTRGQRPKLSQSVQIWIVLIKPGASMRLFFFFSET